MPPSEKPEFNVQQLNNIMDAKRVVDTTKTDGSGSSSSTTELTEKEWNSLMWKLDLRIVPFCGLLYLCSFLDRSNIGNAKLGGIIEDINMTSSEFNVALSIFFVGYVIFEIPSNLMVKKVGPNIWMPLVMLSFGAVTACIAAVHNGAGLMAARFFLGIAEAGLFPAVVFYLTLWYTRRQQAKRIALFFGFSTVAGAFGGVLAYGIMQMDGLGNLEGWRWIFIIEAIPTLVLAIATYFVLPGLPEDSKALTERQRAAYLRRLHDDAGPATETHFSKQQLKDAFTDWKVWVHGLIYICGSIPLYSLSLFFPSIISDMGFQNLEAQAMSAPPYAVACIVTILVAFDGDRRGERAWHIAGPALFGCFGYILLLACKDQGPAALYVSACITVTGVFAHAPAMLSWFTNNIGGHTKRAVGCAIIISIGNAGGAVAGQVYRANDAPQYIRAHSACAVLMFLQACICIAHKYALKSINKKRDNLTPEEHRIACEGEDLGDRHPDFRYIT